MSEYADLCPHCEQTFALPASGFPPATCPRCGKPLEWDVIEEDKERKERSDGPD
jgi:rRNA maturation endonuclease Nob1